MFDLSDLEVKISSDSVKQAADNLDKFERKSASADAANSKMEASYRKAAAAAGAYTGELNRTQQAVDKIKSQAIAGASAMDAFQKMTGLAGYQMRNLSFQINDVATMLAMGASPFQILASQGGQIFQIFQTGERGVGGAIRGVGTAISSTLGPVGLFALGFTAVSLAAVGLYALVSRERRSLEDALEEHARLIAAVKERYDEAAGAAKGLSIQTRGVTEVQVLQNQLDLLVRIKRESEGIAGRAASLVSGQNAVPLELFGIPQSTQPVNDFQGAIDRLQASIARGNPDFIKFREEVGNLGKVSKDRDLVELANNLIKMAEPGADMQMKLEQLRAMQDVLKGIATDAQRAALGLKAVEDPGAVFADSLKAIIAMAPKANEALITQQKLRELEVTFGRAQRAITNERDIEPREALEKQNALNQAYQRARDEIGQNVTAYDTLIQRTKDRIEELQLEAQTAGKTTDVVIALKTAHDLERAAKTAGKPITQDMREEWSKLSDELARYTKLAREASIRRDIGFETRTAGMGAEDVAIAQRLRELYKNDVPAALNSAEAEQIRFNNRINQATDLAGNFATTFVHGLLEGKNGMEALSAACKKVGAAMLAQGDNDNQPSLNASTGADAPADRQKPAKKAA